MLKSRDHFDRYDLKGQLGRLYIFDVEGPSISRYRLFGAYHESRTARYDRPNDNGLCQSRVRGDGDPSPAQSDRHRSTSLLCHRSETLRLALCVYTRHLPACHQSCHNRQTARRHATQVDPDGSRTLTDQTTPFSRRAVSSSPLRPSSSL